MKKYIIFFSFVVCWPFALRTQAQVIYSVRNDKLKIHTFTTLGLDNVRTRKNALYALTDSAFVVADPKELKAAIETWQSTHGDLLPPADSLKPMLTLRKIAFSDLKWAKINKPSGALIGMALGGALGAILGVADAESTKDETFFAYDHTTLILFYSPPYVNRGRDWSDCPALAKNVQKDDDRLEKRFRKWRKYSIKGQLNKIEALPQK